MGFYGQHLDKLLRQTGATVESHGCCGTTPGYWTKGKYFRCGYFAVYASSQTVKLPCGKPRKTPKIADLLTSFKPNIVIVSLGANMVKFSEESIMLQTRSLADAIIKTGAKLYWISSPKGENKPEDLLDQQYETLKKALAGKAYLIDASYTRYYGNDGRHYNGTLGKKMAEMWAQAVVDEIQFGNHFAMAKFHDKFYREF